MPSKTIIPSLIKWTGSKRALANEIYSHFPKHKRYFEPFLGGGALLYLSSLHECYASDIYCPLIEFWKLVKDKPEEVIENYSKQWQQLQSDLPNYFYLVRDRFNSRPNPFDLCFLSRTCVNGIIRFNSSGEFNNSFHLSRKGMKPEKFARIARNWSKFLSQTEFSCCDFAEALDKTVTGDFAYLDPPYAASTNRYQNNIDIEKLFDVLESMNQRGILWILSFDGIRGDTDYRARIPEKMYKKHILIDAGHSKVKKVLSGSNETVHESIYLNF